MKFTSRRQIEDLGLFKTNDHWISSLYLGTDKSRQTRKEIGLELKNLMNEARTRLAGQDLAKALKDSLAQDLDKLNEFAGQAIPATNDAGLAAFSCSAKGFWQDFSLPRAPRNNLVFQGTPYVRPLSILLDEFHSICTLVLDRQEARWYGVFMGDISAIDRITSDVPSRVREGGWQGYESKRIERHIDAHLHDHFKKVSQLTFDLFKKNQYDWLFLGCNEEYRAEFEPLLHPYVRERLKGYLKITSYENDDKILRQSLEMETALRLTEEAALAQSLVSEVEKGGRAVSGLREVLRKLNVHEVQTLILDRNYSQEGRVCPKCHFLYVDEPRCPNEEIKTDKVLDVVHEGVHSAMDSKAQVRYVTPPSGLERYGRIGAFLRFKA